MKRKQSIETPTAIPTEPELGSVAALCLCWVIPAQGRQKGWRAHKEPPESNFALSLTGFIEENCHLDFQALIQRNSIFFLKKITAMHTSSWSALLHH